MKKQFKEILREINFDINYIFLIDSILSSVIVFLISVLILSIFNVSIYIALIPAFMYFIIEYYIRFSEKKSRIVEAKYPELNEMLRTAEDNVSLENPIINELESDVANKLKHVHLSAFLNTKKTSYKLLACIIISFLVIILSVFNINISLILNPIINNEQFNGNNSISHINAIGEKLNISEQIYGENSVAKLGNSLIDIKIKPATFEVNVKEEGELRAQEFYESFPEEVFVEKTTTYEENVPREQQILVKNYFKKLSGG